MNSVFYEVRINDGDVGFFEKTSDPQITKGLIIFDSKWNEWNNWTDRFNWWITI